MGNRRAMVARPCYFTIYKDPRGDWRWNLRAADNRIIATSLEGLDTKEAARDAIDHIKECVGLAGVRIAG